MTNQILEMWQRVLTDNFVNLTALYESISPFLIIIIGVGAVTAAAAIVHKLYRGK